MINLPHGFSLERTHLALLRWISPENDGFKDISGILWARFLQVRPVTTCLFSEIRLCRVEFVLISFDCCLFKQRRICCKGRRSSRDTTVSEELCFEELFLQEDLNAWLLKELGVIKSGRRGWSWETSLSDLIAAARIILGWINSIEEFIFHCLKSRPRAGAGGSIVDGKGTTRLSWFACDFRQLPVCSLDIVKLVILLIYVFSSYTWHIFVTSISLVISFSTLFMFVEIF